MRVNFLFLNSASIPISIFFKCLPNQPALLDLDIILEDSPLFRNELKITGFAGVRANYHASRAPCVNVTEITVS